MNELSETPGRDFIRQIIADDIAQGKHACVISRFPPEPNGYLHIGHVKSICLNFGVAAETGGKCYLRFDDTNPLKESQEFVDAIIEAVRWLGFDWEDRLTHASDYFNEIYACAETLIRAGKAYIDGLSAEEIRRHRGTLTQAGQGSPDRSRPPEESLHLFRRMRAGEFEDGRYVLRAKIDMASPNLNLRDPTLYRIRNISHQRTGSQWSIYPMYDFAHTICDALEGITHSLCTLEFEDHRPLYDWILDQLDMPSRPRQIEFSRLNVAYTVTSKRRLAELIELKHVSGWDDPRMPTVAGLRRRGFTPAALRDFSSRVGVTKKEHQIELALLETCIRDDLNRRASRAMAVLRPLKMVLLNYPTERVELLAAANHPDLPDCGVREIPFGRELWIERDDFMIEPPKKFFRLRPGGEVRLRYAYIVRCEKVILDSSGEVEEIHCTYDETTRSGSDASGRKVKGTIHWVSAAHARVAEVRIYDPLFTVERPDADSEVDFKQYLNSNSLSVIDDCKIEPSLANARPGMEFQFERQGYFVADRVDFTSEQPVFNRVVSLRDTWDRGA